MTQLNTFFEKNKSAHQIDVRSKIFILLTFSVAIFFVEGKGLLFLFFLFVSLVIIDGFVEFRGCPHEFASVIKAVLKVAIPLYVICIVSFLANAITITGGTPSDPSNPHSLILNPHVGGGPWITPEGALRGAFFCGRILLLGWSSLFVANTVSLIEFAGVFKWLFWPLRRFGVPVEDASLAVSIALRFIPEIFIEFQSIQEAQWCRGAKMSSGGVVERTKAHAGCFVPLILRMMGSVDALSDALVVRCWGVFEVPPKEELETVPRTQVALTAIVCSLICSVAVLV